VKWALIIVAILLPCAIVALFLMLEFPSAMIVSFALIAALFFASLPWVAGAIWDHWRTGPSKSPGATIIKPFDQEQPPGSPP
jgi:hypothetical protein